MERYLIEFERCRALKKDNPDAQCSDCRKGLEQTKYWYFIDGKFNPDYIQFCDDCFKKRRIEIL